MSRKFSDSEIRAYSKNRYEDKLLRQRLEKLKESAGIFHDASAKQRQDLVTECKDIRMTTGESRAPGSFVMDTNFDISKRVTRPWAYSVMETTYNAVYRDAVIPLPKQSRLKTRSKSGISRGLVSRSSMYSNRAMSSKSYSPSMKSSLTTRSENISKKLAPTAINRCASNPEIRFQRTNTDIAIKIDESFANDNQCHETDKVIKDAVAKQNLKSSAENTCENIKDPKHSVTKLTAENSGNFRHLEVETIKDILKDVDTHENANSFSNLKTHKIDTRIITLPPVYKIDSKAYQDAERERAISRSRSRVSFSSLAGVHESHDERIQKPKSPTETKRLSPDTAKTDQDHENRQEERENARELEEAENQNKSRSADTIDPETMLDVQVRKQGEIIYRGRRLKNYIKPEERYKLDPLVMKRRQNKMDKLAKESSSFLKRVNHENIRVEIAFPRSARKRILTKLVQENNCSRSKTVKDNNEPVIQQKIQYFMTTVSEYIRQQQLEREEYFS